MGIWGLFIGLGPPVAPLIMGFVVYNKSWEWIFYLLSIMFLALFVLYIFFGPETLYERPSREVQQIPDDQRTAVDAPLATSATHSAATNGRWYTPYISFHRHDPRPWRYLLLDAVIPLKLFLSPPVFLAATAYAVCFTYTNVLLTVETPALLGQKMGLNAQQVGLQFIAYIIGALLGEIFAGYGSDVYMAWRAKRNNGERQPEYRLPFALPGFVLCFVGILVFFIQLEHAQAGRWNVTPLVGGAIAFFGLQLITTSCITYCVESQEKGIPARRAALFVAFWRQIFAFTGPFYFLVAAESLGLEGSGGLWAALQFAFIPVILLLIVYGRRWRQKQIL